ncbi:MAG: hypothetical protein AB2693_23095 [Candidatus Thiodiazotropha sp.]
MDNALLRQQWNLPDIVENIKECRKLLTPENLFTNANIGKGNIRQEREPTAEDMIRMMMKNKNKKLQR